MVDQISPVHTRETLRLAMSELRLLKIENSALAMRLRLNECTLEGVFFFL